MDEDRRIRFLIAPLFFMASLAWAIKCSPSVSLASLFPSVYLHLNNPANWIAVFACGGLALLPLGFAIGTIGFLLLRLIFEAGWHLRWWESRSYEAHLTKAALKDVWPLIRMTESKNRSDAFYAVVVLDHEVLSEKHKGVHGWLFRRWNAFTIAYTSGIALLLSLPVGRLIPNIGLQGWWFWPGIVLCILLFSMAWFSWKDTMRMLTFMAHRLQSKNQTPQPAAKPDKPVEETQTV